jgi:poly(A) RNA polymerase GLD2
MQKRKNNSSQWQSFEEPFDLTNTARSTYDREVFARVKNAFFQSWCRLNEAKDLNVLFQDPLFIKQIIQTK